MLDLCRIYDRASPGIFVVLYVALTYQEVQGRSGTILTLSPLNITVTRSHSAKCTAAQFLSFEYGIEDSGLLLGRV